MKRVYSIALLLFVFFALVACKKDVRIIQEPESGAFQMRYFFRAYYVPTEAVLRSRYGDGEEIKISLEGDTYIKEGESTGRFDSLSNVFGEKGKRMFWHLGPSMAKPCNITGMHIYTGTGKDRRDVSDKYLLSYVDGSDYIKSDYSPSVNDSFCKWKKISELTEHDLMWMSYEVEIAFPERPTERLTLVVSVKNRPDIEFVVWPTGDVPPTRE